MNQFINSEAFDIELEKQFNQDNFYAQPKNTKIIFNIDNGEEIVGNAVVANLEEINEKIPVYSYNSSIYKKYLQGKRLITGVIALRKVTVSTFLSIMKKNTVDNYINSEIDGYKKQLKELEKIRTNVPVELIRVLKNRINRLNKMLDEDNGYIEYKQNERNEFLEIDNLLYYIENQNNGNTNGNNTAKITIQFNNMYENGPRIKIKDVLFVKKQTDINVDKNDIFEVYNFIGNPDNSYTEEKEMVKDNKEISNVTKNDEKVNDTNKADTIDEKTKAIIKSKMEEQKITIDTTTKKMIITD